MTVLQRLRRRDSRARLSASPPGLADAPCSAACPAWLLMLAIGVTTGVDFLENSMVVLASARVEGGIGATPEEFVWITASYATASLLMILCQGQVAARLGYRRFLLLSLALDAVGAVCCGSARGVSSLVVGQAIQGAGAGTLFTSCRVLIQILFSPEERRRAIWFFCGGVSGASALAPLLASLILRDSEWYWVFYGILPAVAVAAALVWLTVPAREGAAAMREAAERREELRRRFDYIPIALFFVALIAAEFVMQRVRFEFLWQSPGLLLLVVVGLAAVAGFLLHQWHVTEPLLHLRVLHGTRQFWWGLAFYFVYYFLTYSFLYLFPLYSEQGLGFSIELTGLLMFFGGAVSLATAFVYLSVSRRVGNLKWLMCPGLVCMGLAAWGFSVQAPGASVASLYLPLVLYGLFGNLLALPVAGLTFQELDLQYFGHGYRLKNIVRQLCNTFAVAVMAATLQHRQQGYATDLAGQLSLADPLFVQRLGATSRALAHAGLSPEDARSAALALVTRAAQHQTLFLACRDGFAFIALLSFAAAIILLCQRRLR